MISGALAKVGIAAVAVALVIGISATAGYQWCNSGKQSAVIDQLEDDADAVAEVREVIKWREKKVVKYVDRIKTVVDPTGCADTPVPPAVHSSMFDAYRTATGSETD